MNPFERPAGRLLHVDDCVLLGPASGPLHADRLLEVIVRSLEDAGFSVSQQYANKDLSKAVGYEFVKDSNILRFPM